MSNEKKSNLLSRRGTGKKDFALSYQPIAYQISVVMNNMYATYGADTVKHVLKDLYGIDLTAKVAKDKVSNE